jgi:hypothetical protein
MNVNVPEYVYLEAVVIRADGTRENLGVIADSRWKLWSFGRWKALARTVWANSKARV